MAELGLADAPRVAGAYLDLLMPQPGPAEACPLGA